MRFGDFREKEARQRRVSYLFAQRGGPGRAWGEVAEQESVVPISFPSLARRFRTATLFFLFSFALDAFDLQGQFGRIDSASRPDMRTNEPLKVSKSGKKGHRNEESRRTCALVRLFFLPATHAAAASTPPRRRLDADVEEKAFARSNWLPYLAAVGGNVERMAWNHPLVLDRECGKETESSLSPLFLRVETSKRN